MLSIPASPAASAAQRVQPEQGFGRAEKARNGEFSQDQKRAASGLRSVADVTGVSGDMNANATSYVGAATEIVRSALNEFRKELGAMLRNIGFDDAVVGRVVKNLIQPIGEALKSGADFTAQLFVAAAQQTTVTGAAGSARSIDLAAKGIEITVNRSTGDVAVTTESLSIHKQQIAGALNGTPHIVDFHDNKATQIPDMFAQFNEYIADQIDAFEELLPKEDELEEDAAKRLAVPGAEAAPVEVELPETEADPGRAVRLAVEAVEQFTNESGEQITRIRLDALIRFSIETIAAGPEAAAGPVYNEQGPLNLTV
jgi:hypothetical protein